MQAFVLFRSLEGVERTLYAFQAGKIARFLYTVCICCRSQRHKDRFFRGYLLNVAPSVEPELLIWENFGVGKFSKAIRYILYIIFVILMLAVCFYIISYLELL